MSTVEKFVGVNVPVGVAYDQWTQFEDFPKFMEGVRKVEQLDDTSRPSNSGVVSFHPLDANRTRVFLEMEYEPRGVVENAGDMLGVVSMRLKGDLDRFKKFIEARGVETGAWRGSV